jgi:hypothetical protein
MIRFHVLVNAWARPPQVEDDTLTLNRLQTFCETEGFAREKDIVFSYLTSWRGAESRVGLDSPSSARFVKRQRRALLVDAA